MPSHPTAYLIAFTVYLVLYMAYASSVPGLFAGPARLASLWGFLLLIPVPFLVLRALGATDVRTAIAWRGGRGVRREIGAGLVGYCAGLPIIALGVLATNWLATYAPVSHPIADMMDGQASAVVLFGLFAVAAGFAPLVEELFFRGVLLAHLVPRVGVAVALLASGLVFAAIHPQGVAGLPALTAIAIVLGGLRLWRGSLIAPITAHALHNGLLMLILIVAAS